MAHQYSRVGFNSSVEVNEVNLSLSYGGVVCQLCPFVIGGQHVFKIFVLHALDYIKSSAFFYGKSVWNFPHLWVILCVVATWMLEFPQEIHMLSVRRGKVKEPSRFLPFLPDFSSFFPIFPLFSRFFMIFPLFPDFRQIIRCQGWHSAPLPPSGYATGSV